MGSNNSSTPIHTTILPTSQLFCSLWYTWLELCVTMSLQVELVLLNATFMEEIVTGRSDMLPIHQRESLSHWGICNQLYICITFNGISRMNGQACLLGRSPIPFVLWRSNRDLTLWVCTIPPAVESTVGRLLGICVPPTALSNVHLPLFFQLPTSEVLNLSIGTKKWKNTPLRVGCHNPH